MASTLNAKNRIQKKKKSFLFSSQQNITKHSRCQWHYFSGLQQPPPPKKNNENKRINDTNVRHNMFHFLFYFLFVCIYSISFGSFLTRHVEKQKKISLAEEFSEWSKSNDCCPLHTRFISGILPINLHIELIDSV